jgi:hypothetical protein
VARLKLEFEIECQLLFEPASFVSLLLRHFLQEPILKKLYVGSLPYSVDDSQLASLLGQFGQVASAKVIMDRESGRSKGFGFVEMENDDDAAKAIEGLHDKDFGGRNLVVNEARPMEPRSGGGGGGFRGGSGGGGGGRGGRDRDRGGNRGW